MIIKRIYILIPLILIFTGGCGKASPEKGSGEAIVHIHATVVPEILQTKTLITGTTFPNEGNYGIFVCDNGSTSAPHKSNSWNIRATYSETEDKWSYNYVGNLSTGSVTSYAYENIAITEKEMTDIPVTADLYAYSPYVQGAYAGGPTAIPYSIRNDIIETRNLSDLMYAQENISGANTGLDPASPLPLSATFTFKHAFALLAFKFKIKNEPSRYILDYYNVTLNDPDDDGTTTAKLYSSGSFNAITGTFNHGGADEVEASSLWFSLGNAYTHYISSQSSATTVYMTLVPTQVEDNELVFRFQVNGKFLQPFYLQKEHLLHPDGITYGFQSGYMYTFNFILDNYLFFDSFSISNSWTDEILGSQHI